MKNDKYVTEDEKKNILSDLLVEEEYTRGKLQAMVLKSKKLFKIKPNTGDIVFESHEYIVKEKIQLFLVARYFSKEMGIIKSDKFTLADISEGIGTKTTALSQPISHLTDQNIIVKEKNDYFVYFIRSYQIDRVIGTIYDKYVGNKENIEKTKKTKESKQKGQLVPQPSSVNDSERIEKLASDAHVDAKSLYNIFKFGDELKIIAHLEGKKERPKQIKAALILLTAYDYYYNVPEITSSELRKQLEDLGLSKTALVNLSTNIRKYNEKKQCDLILPEGRKKGYTKTKYKITRNGIEEGLKLIKEICDIQIKK